MNKIVNIRTITELDAQKLGDEVAKEVQEHQDKGRDVEIQYSASVCSNGPNGTMVFSAMVIAREK